MRQAILKTFSSVTNCKSVHKYAYGLNCHATETFNRHTVNMLIIELQQIWQSSL